MWYNLDAQNFMLQAFPPVLRKSRLVSFIALIAGEISTVNDVFQRNRDQNIIRLTHNSQVCKLEKILNDSFDYLRRIKITDSILHEPLYIFTDAELQPEWLDPELAIYTDQETAGNDADFYINIPAELQNYIIEISSLTNKYKLASMRFNIIINDQI